MTAKNPQKQERILKGGGGIFVWLARIYTPVFVSAKLTRTMFCTIVPNCNVEICPRSKSTVKTHRRSADDLLTDKVNCRGCFALKKQAQRKSSFQRRRMISELLLKQNTVTTNRSAELKI